MGINVEVKDETTPTVFPILMRNEQGVIALFWQPGEGVIVDGGTLGEGGPYRNYLVGMQAKDHYAFSEFKIFYGAVIIRNQL